MKVTDTCVPVAHVRRLEAATGRARPHNHAREARERANAACRVRRERSRGLQGGHVPFGPSIGASMLGASIYELPPGQAICPYHYEYGNEEWLLVLEGAVTLRHPEGTRSWSRGTSSSSRPARRAPTSVRNETEETARVLMFSTMTIPSVDDLPGQRQDRRLAGRRPRQADGQTFERGRLLGGRGVTLGGPARLFNVTKIRKTEDRMAGGALARAVPRPAGEGNRGAVQRRVRPHLRARHATAAPAAGRSCSSRRRSTTPAAAGPRSSRRRRGGDRRGDRHDPRDGAHGGAVRELRRASRARLPGRPGADRAAVLHQLGRIETGGGVVEKKATFGAGCFWGVEAAFRQLDGVTETRGRLRGRARSRTRPTRTSARTRPDTQRSSR